MQVSPLAGKPADPSNLINVPRLVTAYYTGRPDPSVAEQRVVRHVLAHEHDLETLRRSHEQVGRVLLYALTRLRGNVPVPLEDLAPDDTPDMRADTKVHLAKVLTRRVLAGLAARAAA